MTVDWRRKRVIFFKDCQFNPTISLRQARVPEASHSFIHFSRLFWRFLESVAAL